ncbi:hypothetical protein [Microcoleus sp. B4-D4]|uniref:hypothetical protein n=1 Tax=Microcoleus sp. B4-D4 TaxID=2818667 RepID=UPI002FD47B1B
MRYYLGLGIGRSEAEGLGIGNWAKRRDWELGGAKRRDWELGIGRSGGIGRSEAEGLGIGRSEAEGLARAGHWAILTTLENRYKGDCINLRSIAKPQISGR